jgi:hypothetical protein
MKDNMTKLKDIKVGEKFTISNGKRTLHCKLNSIKDIFADITIKDKENNKKHNAQIDINITVYKGHIKWD